MFDVVELIRNTIKSKLIYNGYVIPFGGGGYWVFSDELVISVLTIAYQNVSEIVKIFIYIS